MSRFNNNRGGFGMNNFQPRRGGGPGGPMRGGMMGNAQFRSHPFQNPNQNRRGTNNFNRPQNQGNQNTQIKPQQNQERPIVPAPSPGPALTMKGPMDQEQKPTLPAAQPKVQSPPPKPDAAAPPASQGQPLKPPAANATEKKDPAQQSPKPPGPQQQGPKPAAPQQGPKPGNQQGPKPAGPQQGQKPAAGPQQGQKPAVGPQQGQKPGGAGPQQGQEPGGAGPQQVQKPSGAGPQQFQKPGGAGPQQVQKPGGGGPQQGQKPGAGGPQQGQNLSSVGPQQGPKPGPQQSPIAGFQQGQKPSPQQNQRPGPPQQNQRPGPPQQNQRPGPPQQNQRPGPPQQNQRPGPPQQNQRPGAPQQNQRPGAPQQNQRPGPPQQNQRPGAQQGHRSFPQQTQRADLDSEQANMSCTSESGDNQEKGFTAPLSMLLKPGEKAYTQRCRLFVGNLPSDITEEILRKMFAKYGEPAEVFINKGKGFGFIRLESRALAEIAKTEMDDTPMRGRPLRVRFATHSAALSVKNLSPYVSNELLEEAFSQFGLIERAIVVVDDRGRSTGKGIVEFASRIAAKKALDRCNDGVFLLTTSPRPVIVEPLEQFDCDDGLPEKLAPKNHKYQQEREQPPRFARPGTFEFEYSKRWKSLDEMEKQQREQVEKNMREAREKLDSEMEDAYHEHQANMLRQELLRRQEELRRMEEIHTQEMQKRKEMQLRQEEERRRREEELLRKREMEEQLRRQREESYRMGNFMDQRELRMHTSGAMGIEDISFGATAQQFSMTGLGFESQTGLGSSPASLIGNEMRNERFSQSGSRGMVAGASPDRRRLRVPSKPPVKTDDWCLQEASATCTPPCWSPGPRRVQNRSSPRYSLSSRPEPLQGSGWGSAVALPWSGHDGDSSPGDSPAQTMGTGGAAVTVLKLDLGGCWPRGAIQRNARLPPGSVQPGSRTRAPLRLPSLSRGPRRRSSAARLRLAEPSLSPSEDVSFDESSCCRRSRVLQKRPPPSLNCLPAGVGGPQLQARSRPTYMHVSQPVQTHVRPQPAARRSRSPALSPRVLHGDLRLSAAQRRGSSSCQGGPCVLSGSQPAAARTQLHVFLPSEEEEPDGESVDEGFMDELDNKMSSLKVLQDPPQTARDPS